MNRKQRRAEDAQDRSDAKKISRLLGSHFDETKKDAREVISQEKLDNGHAIIQYKWADWLDLKRPYHLMLIRGKYPVHVASFETLDGMTMAYLTIKKRYSDGRH